MACDIQYALTNKDASFEVASGDVETFDISTTETGLVNPDDGELIKAFGTDADGNQRIDAVVTLKSTSNL